MTLEEITIHTSKRWRNLPNIKETLPTSKIIPQCIYKMGPEPSYKWNLNPYQWGDWGYNPYQWSCGPPTVFWTHLETFSFKVSSGSYWGWNGLHDTRCASTELELPSSNFRFMGPNGSNAACGEGREVPWALGKHRETPSLKSEISWSLVVKWTWMNKQLIPPPKKNNWTVASVFFCWFPLLQFKIKDLFLVQWSFLSEVLRV